jgi:hypothetical protein
MHALRSTLAAARMGIALWQSCALRRSFRALQFAREMEITGNSALFVLANPSRRQLRHAQQEARK